MHDAIKADATAVCWDGSPPQGIHIAGRLMKDLAQEGRTMLVVTHEIGFAVEVGSRMIFMDEGRIVEEAAPREMLANPKNPRTQQFLRSIL